MPLQPAAIAIILRQSANNQTEVLLTKRNDVPVWVLPGGGIEKNETEEMAVKREVQEETGYDIAIIRKCAEYSPINQLAAFTSVYLCKIVSGTPLLSHETSKIAFFPIQSLPQSLIPPHALWIKEALSHESLIQRNLTEVSYLRLLQYFIKHPLQIIRFAWTRFMKKP